MEVNILKTIKVHLKRFFALGYTSIYKILDREFLDSLNKHYAIGGEVVVSEGKVEWYLNNEYHRTDGPAIEQDNGTKSWYLNGQRHREDGPAIEFQDGSQFWYQYGKLHREHGPAIRNIDGNQEWWINGELHREDGPAIMWGDGTETWFLYHMKLTEDEFNNYLAKKSLKKALISDLPEKKQKPKVKI